MRSTTVILEWADALEGLAGEMRAVAAAEEALYDENMDRLTGVSRAMVAEPRSTFYERGGDVVATLRSLRHTIVTMNQGPVKLVRSNGREVVLVDEEDINHEFGQ